MTGDVTDREKELADEIWRAATRATATRAQVEAEIVAWLRRQRCGISNDSWDKTLNIVADAIERGECRREKASATREAGEGA